MSFWRKHKQLSTRGLVISIISLLAVISLAALFFLLHNRTPTGHAEMQSLRSTIGKLAILPTGEDPTLATVKDKSKLTDPILKANAQNGDKILIYIKAKRVYIYRPSVHKLVNIVPLNLQASAAEVRGARIAIWQGNGSASSAQTIYHTLAQQYPSAKVSSTISQAKRQDYPSTIVIDLTDGDKYDLATNIMGSIGGQRGVLPQLESKPANTDILIIVGTDKN